MLVKVLFSSTSLVLASLIMSGCDNKPPQKPQSSGVPQEASFKRLDGVQQAAIQSQGDAKKKAREKLAAATDKELTAMLSRCRGAVFDEANTKNSGPFAVALVDEYSADIYIYAAGSTAVKSFEERIASYRRNGVDLGYINTNFAIVSAYDSFSGSQKSVTTYYCETGENLEILGVEKRL